MAFPPRIFPFRWVLPCAQLLLCFAVLWPVRGLLLLGVSENPFFGLILKAGMISNPVLSYLVVPPSTPDEERRAVALARHWEIRRTVPVALNLPVLLVQLPYYVVLNPEKREWVPKGMSFEVWRALSCPFAGMLFWWFAGRGIEACVQHFNRWCDLESVGSKLFLPEYWSLPALWR